MVSAQIREALDSFVAEMRARPRPRARARELVSWFALGHLLPTARPGRALSDALQVGIEFAVPQRKSESNPRKNPDVCKDVVILREPRTLCWDDAGIPTTFPIAVLEWKVVPLNARPALRRDREAQAISDDIPWLQWYTETAPEAVGFSIVAYHLPDSFDVAVARVQNGTVDPSWYGLSHPWRSA